MTNERRKRRPAHHSKHNNVRRRRSSSKRFRRGLLIYMGSLAAIGLIVLVYMTFSLARYQKNIDTKEAEEEQTTSEERAPQLCFLSYYENMDTNDWIEAWNKSHTQSFDSDDDISAFIQSYADPSLCSCYKADSYTASSPAYLIRSGSTDFAVVNMEGSGDDWWISGIDFLVAGDRSGSVTVPDGCTVACNGIALDSSYITGTSSLESDFKYSDSLTDPIEYSTYTVSGLISDPVFTADSADSGNSVAEVNGNYYLTLTDAAADTYRTNADAFIKALLKYYSQGKNNLSENLNTVLSYVVSGSDASNIIRQSQEGVSWKYADNASYTTQPSDVCILASNCYFVDVTYSDESSDSSEEECYRVYFLNKGSGFKIYAFSLI